MTSSYQLPGIKTKIPKCQNHNSVDVVVIIKLACGILLKDLKGVTTLPLVSPKKCK